MRDSKRYTDYAVEQAVRLLNIDSPTGYTDAVASHNSNYSFHILLRFNKIYSIIS